MFKNAEHIFNLADFETYDTFSAVVCNDSDVELTKMFQLRCCNTDLSMYRAETTIEYWPKYSKIINRARAC